VTVSSIGSAWNPQLIPRAGGGWGSFESSRFASGAAVESGADSASGVASPNPPTLPTITASRLNDTTVRYTLTGGSGLTQVLRYYRAPAGSGPYSASATINLSTGYFDVPVASLGNCDAYITDLAGTVSSSVVTGSAGSSSIYSDDFETATVGSNIAGRGNSAFSWDAANPSSNSVLVSSDRAASGAKSLKFSYGATLGQNLEQRFTLANRQPEIYIGFKIWIPVGFENLVRGGQSYNKKFLALWCEDVYAGWGACIFEHEADGNGNSTLTPTYRDQTNSSSHGFQDSVIFIDKVADAGTWMKVGIRVKQQTNSTVTGSGSTYRGSGIVEVWKNNVLFRSITNFPNWNPNGNTLKYGYLLGAANGGFDVQTDFYVDDFIVADNSGAIAEYLP
jgi:hypothetical protein